MTIWMAIAAGGAIGSLARHAVNHTMQAYALATRFPAATAVVNLSGCVVIGLLAGLLASGRLQLPAAWREFVFVGLLGGFTTFSTFGLETLVLARTGAPLLAAWNAGLHVAGGLLAVWAGYQAGIVGAR